MKSLSDYKINEKKKEPDAYDISQYSKGISILLSIPDTYCWSWFPVRIIDFLPALRCVDYKLILLLI